MSYTSREFYRVLDRRAGKSYRDAHYKLKNNEFTNNIFAALHKIQLGHALVLSLFPAQFENVTLISAKITILHAYHSAG